MEYSEVIGQQILKENYVGSETDTSVNSGPVTGGWVNKILSSDDALLQQPRGKSVAGAIGSIKVIGSVIEKEVIYEIKSEWSSENRRYEEKYDTYNWLKNINIPTSALSSARATNPSTPGYYRAANNSFIHHLLSNFEYTSELGYRSILAQRLRDLYEESIKLPDQDALSKVSLITFLSFLNKHPKWKMPMSVITPSGSVRGVWKSGHERLAINFINRDKAKLVIFVKNKNNTNLIDRFTGVTSTDSIDVYISNANPDCYINKT
ncbi:MAG: hypothetical protein ABW141_17650 [Candidatus Thiodiazotropha endolucinida]